jgi:AAA+ superfamily predicted ATPase
MGQESWSAQNYQYLSTYVAYVLAVIEQRGNGAASIPPRPNPADFTRHPAPALGQLATLLGLSLFEQEVLVLGVAAEMDRSLGAVCATLNGNPQQTFPTFRVALSALAEPHWQSLMPTAPLRHWHLIDLATGTELTQARLRIDERILHELMGLPYADVRLRGVMRPVPPRDYPLATSHRAIADKIATLLHTDPQVPVQLCGHDAESLQHIATVAGWQLQRPVWVVSAEALPTELAQSNLVQRLCEREALLSRGIVLLVCDRLSEEGAAAVNQSAAVTRFIEQCGVPLIITQPERRTWGPRSTLTFEVESLTAIEQRQLWEIALKASPVSAADLDHLVSTFNLNAQMIHTVVAQTAVAQTAIALPQLTHRPISPITEPSAKSSPTTAPSPTALASLWQTCLTQSRPRFDGLAQQIQSQVGWEDLVLPEKEIAVLRTIAAHVRQRSRVYDQWGFGAKSRRGLGISALFAGSSGTGKTLAAEVLANELHLDLHRIDISAVVSKYIGETEKNLRKIFDAAESGGAILLFDEADALFGKRSDVKDSHDRYANMEVAYLLQRIEAYRGLAILTTNLKDAIDQAFLRRIRFVVQFPFPDVAQRTEIWRRVFPAEMPTQTLSHHKLARLSVAGGNIRNIALNAAFLAADAEEAVGMTHILQAAQAEYMKLERPLTDQEVRGWTNSGEPV